MNGQWGVAGKGCLPLAEAEGATAACLSAAAVARDSARAMKERTETGSERASRQLGRPASRPEKEGGAREGVGGEGRN